MVGLPTIILQQYDYINLLRKLKRIEWYFDEISEPDFTGIISLKKPVFFSTSDSRNSVLF